MTTKLEVMGNGNGRAMKPAKAAPTLPKGNDAEVAGELRRLVTAAEDGLRRILVAGFFMDRIAAELPHGKLTPWLEAHCPDISDRTARRWMELARNVSESCGIKTDTRVRFDIPALLTLPAASVPEEQAEVRSTIDEMIAGKSYRQLFLEFKQAEEGADGKLRKKVGRRAGEGGRQGAGDLTSQLAAARKLALEDWDNLDELLVHGYRAKFALLDDTRIEAQIGTLEMAIKARRLWLNTPTERRDGATTEAIEALFPR